MHRFITILASVFVATSTFAAGHDLSPIVYDGAAFYAENPQISWNGSKYLAVWRANSAIFGAFIGADGTPLSATPIAFPDIPGSGGASMRIAAIGSDFLVILPGYPPHTAIIHADGTYAVDAFNLGLSYLAEVEFAVNGSTIAVLDRYSDAAYFYALNGTVKRTASLPDYASAVGIAAWQGGFIAITANLDGLRIYRFDVEGNSTAAIERIPLQAGGYAREMYVATSGPEVVAVWTEYDGTFTRHFRAARFADRAKVIGFQSSPTSAAWTGSGFLIGTSAGFVRVARDGTVVDTTDIAGVVARSIAGHDGTAYALALYPVTGTAIAAAEGQVRSTQQAMLHRAPRAQFRPLVTSNGVDLFALWEERGASMGDVATVRLDRNGIPTAQPSTAAYNVLSTLQDLAISGSTQLAIYANYSNLRAQRFAANGERLDAEPFTIRDGSIYYAFVAAAPHGFVVGWIDNSGVWAALVGEDGTVGAPKAVAQHPIAKIAGVYDGSQFIFLTGTGLPGIFEPFPPESYRIDAIRLRDDLSRIDASPVVLEKAARQMSIASNGDGALIVLDRYDEHDVVSLRINSALRVESATTIFEWQNPPLSDVTWDGRDFVIATHHDDWLTLSRVDARNVLRSSRVTPIQAQYADIPSIAATSVGDAVAVISVYPGRADTVRARSYPESELPLAPAAPPAPVITSFDRNFNDVTVTWTSAATDVESFVIEGSSDFETWGNLATVPGSVRTKSISPFYGKSVRIRAVRGPRASEPSANAGLQPRRRAVR